MVAVGNAVWEKQFTDVSEERNDTSSLLGLFLYYGM
jgi:hypothetical protein